MTFSRDVRDPHPLSTSEVARILGVSTRTVYRMIDAGTLTPLFKLPGPNGAYLFDRAAVEALARSAA